jgi:hypothetical protein
MAALFLSRANAASEIAEVSAAPPPMRQVAQKCVGVTHQVSVQRNQ